MSAEPEKLDFLNPGVRQIRHQIRGILDSYSHEWDIIGELCQNAVDAIRARGTEKGHISIRVDASQSEIEVSDNGIGISRKELPLLLRPFSSNKIDKPNQVGSKGVGIAFVIFSSSIFEIETNDGSSAVGASIVDAAHWVESSQDDAPNATMSDSTKLEIGTRVKIRVQDQDHPIFSMSAKELEFVLRTKTAIGNTDSIWSDDVSKSLESDVKLSHTTKDGLVTNKEFECHYLLPIDDLKKTDLLDITEFEEWLKGDRSDAEKRRKLKDKIIFHSEWSVRANRTLKWWSCFVPTRSWWDELNTLHGLKTASGDVENNSTIGFSSGLFTLTKGMPTGIILDLKPKGAAGYVPNFFVIIEDPELAFDIGRKAIPGRQQGMLRDIANTDFRLFVNRVQKHVSGEPEGNHGGWDKSREFADVGELLGLSSPKTRFSRRPDAQEATVAAIFYEQIGRGEFKNISPMLSGYKKKYDLYASYDGAETVIEFKYNLSDLIGDFNDAKKMFDQVDIVVVWEVTEADFQLAGRRGLSLESVIPSTLSKEKSDFHYRLELGMVDPVYVISMKKQLGLD